MLCTPVSFMVLNIHTQLEHDVLLLDYTASYCVCVCVWILYIFMDVYYVLARNYDCIASFYHHSSVVYCFVILSKVLHCYFYGVRHELGSVQTNGGFDINGVF